MPRIVWSSPPAETTFLDHRNGRRYSGKYRVRLALFEPGEALTKRYNGRDVPLTQKVFALRAKAGPGRPIRLEPVGGHVPVRDLGGPPRHVEAAVADAEGADSGLESRLSLCPQPERPRQGAWPRTVGSCPSTRA